MFKYIADKDHYTEVLSRCEKVKHDIFDRISGLTATFVL